MKLRIDLHIHTADSSDAFIEPEQLPLILKRKGLDGVAVTNHDIYTGGLASEGIVIPGIEVSTEQGHVIGLGPAALGSIPSGRPADETISMIHAAGGVAIIPHPFDPVSPCVNPCKLRSRPDAIEAINADALFFRLNTAFARRVARRLGLPMVAGSDSHIPETVGDAYTLVESKSTEIEDILNAIGVGFVQPMGGPTSLTRKALKLARSLRKL